MDMTRQLVWSHGDISSVSDLDLLEELANSYVNSHTINIKNIREVARSSSWRYRWQLGRSQPESLFARKIQDLTPEQNLLVFWSQVYDMAFESYDPPQRHIVR